MWWKLVCLLALVPFTMAEDSSILEKQAFSIEGNVIFPANTKDQLWSANSRVILNHGQYLGFVQDDGAFVVNNVPSGSYVVQVENVDFVFEPIRVDITAKGKMRARKLNVLQPNSVNQLPYPLKLTARETTKYFRKREEWRVTDMLMSPMVLMLALPLLVMLILPKIAATDPSLQKEMEQMQMPRMDMPDLSEMLTNYISGSKPQKKKTGSGPSKKK
ncbi:unnamed protein product [Auanema sp. JU1783]|nr:unnamed protein product [Auanema sp. JU1783]